MLNKLRQFIKNYNMVCPGDCLICAVSGGADSVALLFAMYLLREKLKITLAAAHFNHCLRGEESDRDENFVRQLCDRLDIPLYIGSGKVVAGKKGLEAAARDARYAFLKTLDGKIATAHTANDNLETVLMHLVRGTGLKGLGGISPINGKLIRPMLEVTRDEVLAFLEEYHLSYVTDSTNAQNQFMRNRLRNQVIPLLEQENPSLATNVTMLAQRLRQDEAVLQECASSLDYADVTCLRDLEPALRSRAIFRFLLDCGVKEPESKHILSVEKLVFSDNPSACVSMQNDIVISRCYDRLQVISKKLPLEVTDLLSPGVTELSTCEGYISCKPATELISSEKCFTVTPVGKIRIRHRLPGDCMRLSGGRKELKKLFIDRKFPAAKRLQIPIIVDDAGVIGVFGIGPNLDRICFGEGAVEIQFISGEKKEEE